MPTAAGQVLVFRLTLFSECSVPGHACPHPSPIRDCVPCLLLQSGGGATSHHPCLQPRLPGNGSWGQQVVSGPQNRQDLGVKGHKSQSCFHCSLSLSLWRNYPLSEKQFLHLQVRIKPFSVSADSIGGRLHRDGHKKLQSH